MLQSIKTIKFKEYIVVPLAICRGQKVSLGAMPPLPSSNPPMVVSHMDAIYITDTIIYFYIPNSSAV